MRVVFLCAPVLSEFNVKVIETFFRTDRHSVCGCLVDGRPAEQLRDRLWRNLRRGRGGYVAVMAVNALRRRRAPVVDTEAFFGACGISTVVTDEPYGAGIRIISEWQPDVLLLLGGFGIIKEPLLSAAPHRVLSYHHGDVRRYRGMPPAFWELYNGESEMGITVQRIAAQLDAGEPILERQILLRRGDTLGAVQKRAFDESVDMLLGAVDRLGEPDFRPSPVDQLGRLYTLPNLRQWLRLHAMLAARRREGRVRTLN